ncbi:MAG: ABC transporter permease [Phycisphaerae bacterium]
MSSRLPGNSGNETARSTGAITLGIAAAMLLLALLAWVAGNLSGLQVVGSVAKILGVIALVALVVWLALQSGVRAVVRQTFLQCFRSRVAGLFIALLVITLGTMPFVMTGDGTLSGRLRTFLSYGTSMTALLLSLVTLFLSVSVVASDVETRTIFTTCTKPLSRWQYIIGRWFGVLLFDVILLAVAAVALLSFAFYLRTQEPLNARDRRVVESEVFAARRRVSPVQPDVEALVIRRIQELKETGRYDDVVKDFADQAGGNINRARELMVQELARIVQQQLQSARPGGWLVWHFPDIDVAGREVTGTGEIDKIADRDIAYINREGKRVEEKVRDVRVRTSRKMVGLLLHQIPVYFVDPQTGEDIGVGKEMTVRDDWFIVQFPPREAERLSVQNLKEGQEVTLRIPPTVQVSYKAVPVGQGRVDTLRSGWYAENRESNRFYADPGREDPVKMRTTLSIPASLVMQQAEGPAGEKHEDVLEMRYINLSNGTVMINSDDIHALYNVGSFEANFARAMGLVLLRLVFVAAIGVFMGSFLSFTVGALVAGVLLVISLAMPFFSEATTTMPGQFDLFATVGGAMLKFLSIFVPNLSGTSPVDSLVGGLYISWQQLGTVTLLTIGWRVAVVLLAACLLFNRREVAAVQV